MGRKQVKMKKRNKKGAKAHKNKKENSLCDRELKKSKRIVSKPLCLENDFSLAIYDENFAKWQELCHFGACVVCSAQGYFMNLCSRCGLARYCSHKCLKHHFTRPKQQQICARNVIFNQARERIPIEWKLDIFNNKGFCKISSQLHCVPRREIYEMMGGPRTVILLKVVIFKVLIPYQAMVEIEDSDGQRANVHFFTPAGINIYVWMKEMTTRLQPGNFLLLFDAQWNCHRDKNTAAVNSTIVLNVPGPEEIYGSISV